MTKRIFSTIATVVSTLLLGLCLGAIATAENAATKRVEVDGTIHVSAFDLPESAYLSDETRAELKRQRHIAVKERKELTDACPVSTGTSVEEMAIFRRCQEQAYYKMDAYKDLRKKYPVRMTLAEIGGVYTEAFTPAQGVAEKNKKRVLINVHGGGFQTGSRTASHLESIPIASIGKIKVISIDYRMAPEYTFPAASEDVAAVYRELLKEYKAENIGLYGCSAGGVLTAQSVAWFQNEGLSLPGAVGMFCAAASQAITADVRAWVRSDGAYITGALAGQNYEKLRNPYFKGAINSSLSAPANYDQVMAKFPPSLLISSTRDFLLSDVIATHAQLTRLGVEADLHIWEGLEHGFIYNPRYVESREAFNVIVKFFDKHLGQ